MLNNYFKVSVRGLMKNPFNSAVNIVGLSLAIGFCVFAYAFTRWTLSTDQFHVHKNEVYLVSFFANRDGSQQEFGRTPRPLGEMMRSDFAQIKKVCRVEDRNVVVKQGENVFHERVRYTDPEFLDMFTFPLKWGRSSSLKDVNSIILSENMSIKYFGNENPMGQNIQLIFGKGNRKEFKVAGVAKKFPDALTIAFDFLINIQNFRTSEPSYDFHDWNAFVNATLIQVDNPGDLGSIEQGIHKYIAIQNEAVKEEWAITSFAFEPLANLHVRSEFIRDDISRSSGSNHKTIIFLLVIGFFILALACFNYINIAIVTATKRLKEIGVRKSIGATRRAVIVQFLSENIIISSFALLLGLLLGYFFLIPGFEQLWNFSMGFKFTDVKLWLFLPSVLILTGIASGAYPAFYISRFQTVNILKGAVKFGHKNPVTKVFLGLQLIFACIFIAIAVTLPQNNEYVAHRSWGYQQADVLFAVVADHLAFEELQAQMLQDHHVLSISGSAQHIGKSSASAILRVPGREIEVDQLAVDARYFVTMGIQMKEGRVFNDHEGSDSQAVIVNELLVKNMSKLISAWDSPVGQRFKIDSTDYEVIGVAKDFHSQSFGKPIKPTFFKVADKADYRYLSLKVKPGTEKEMFSRLEASWIKLFPEIPFEGGYQEDVWANYFKEIGIHATVWNVIAIMAIILASLGLYGLIKLNVEGRNKEFSIRKVLGAGTKNIASSITRQYLVLFAIALTIGAPIGYLLAKFILDVAYAYHMPVDFSSSSISVLILITVLLITVSSQVMKVSKSNPMDGLKVE